MVIRLFKYNLLCSGRPQQFAAFTGVMLSLLLFLFPEPPVHANPIGNDNTLRVTCVVLADFQPQYSLDASGKPSGFAIDVFERLAGMANLEVRYLVKGSWPEAIEALKTGEADVIPNMGMAARREAFVDFTAPVETFPVSIFVRESEKGIRGRKDLSWRKVAVLRVNVGYNLLMDDNTIELVVAEHRSDALMLLLSGQVDAFVYPEPVVWLDARRAGIDGLIKTAGEPLAEIARGVGVSKKNPELLQRLDGAVRRFVLTGDYRRIYSKWYGGSEPFWTPAKVLRVAGGIMAAIIASMVLMHYRTQQRHRRELEQRVRDRTERLEDLNRTFITLLENTTDYIFFKDRDFRFTAVSQTMAESTGHKHWRDLIGKNEMEVFPREIATIYTEGEQRLIHTGEPTLNSLEPFLTPEGEQRHLMTKKWPIKDEEGKVVGLFGIARDITELMRAEQALKENEERLRDIIDNAPVGIFRTMPDGGYDFINMEFARTLGYADPEDMARNISNIRNSYADPSQREKITGLLGKQGKVADLEIRMKKKDGSDAWMSVNARTIYDESGKPQFYDGFTVDVTEKTLIHRALRESEQRQRAIFRTAPVGFALIKNRILADCNEHLAKMFGYGKQDMIGKATRMFYVSDEEWERVGNEVYPALSAGQIVQLETKMLHAGGRAMDMLMSCSMIGKELPDQTTIIAMQDITASKQAERELRALNEELEQYAYVVSHDLKAPLRAIHNYADFIREDLDERLLSDDLRLYLNGLAKAVDQGEKLVEDLLALARIGRSAGKTEVVELTDLVPEVASGLAFSPEDELRIGQLPRVRADVTLLRQIIQNLISNGLKFNNSSPKVISVRWNDHGSGGELTFTDNGIGMEEQYYGQVFRLFQRLHTESEYEGTGVGLAIVKKAVEMIGASITLSSTPGQGSTFKIILPESLIAGKPATTAQRQNA